MKAFKLMGTAAAAAVLLLTSCLGEADNTMSRGGFAVAGISDKSYKTILNTALFPLYSASLGAQVVDGACYQISYEVDLGSPENVNASTNGYYVSTISVLGEITKGQSVFYNVPDSAQLVDNDELIVKNMAASGELGVYIDGHLFLGITIDELKDQRNQFTLYWDRSKEPTLVDKTPTYDLFMRVVKTADGTGSSSTSTGEIRAFNIKTVLESVNSAESSKGSEGFNLKINYLKTINEKDSTDLTWSSYTIPFTVVKTS